MTALKETNIRLPEELVDRVREMVRSGRYESESDLIIESLTMLLDRDSEVEDWLKNRVAPAYDRWQVDRKSFSLDEAFQEDDDMIVESTGRHRA